MPRQSRGPYLWLRPSRKRARDGSIERAVWLIRDGIHRASTGCGAEDRPGAEARLSAYLAAKHEAPRRERRLDEIPVADVIGLYLTDIAPSKARPGTIAARCERLIEFFGDKTLDQVAASSCRAYSEWREGKGPAVMGGRKGTGGGARRDLQDLSAAIGHHALQGYHRGVVRVALPKRGAARQRWLDRHEVAKLLWTCWRYREMQAGKPTGKRPLRHVCRFLLLALYTGSRPGAVTRASWMDGPGLSFVDLQRGVFHRRAGGVAETDKRQPTVRLAPRLAAHLRRWRRLDAALSPPGVFVVTFNNEPIVSIKVALGTAAGLAEIPPVTAYALRHTCASWLMGQGVPTRKIADFIGTSEKMVLDHYGHLAPDFQEEAALAIGLGGGRGGGKSARPLKAI